MLIYECLHVDRTYSDAPRTLNAVFEPKRLDAEPELSRLPLQTPLGKLSKEVLVTYAPDAEAEGRRWKVHWTPDGGGLYPDFDFLLTIRSHNAGSLLELRGEYAPPLGTFGQLFDQAVGWRIATSTARALLERIADRLPSE